MMKLSFLLGPLVFCLLPQSAKGNEGCTHNCMDLASYCMAVRDENYFLLFGNPLGLHLPVTCEDGFYSYHCQLSCGICTLCEASPDQITAEPKQLKISSAEGEGTKTPTSVIENAFDGDNSTEGNKCYVQNAMRPKEGRFTIPEAEVTNVFLLGKSHGGSTWKLVDTVVRICMGGISNCTPCGRVTENPAGGEFFDVKCAAGAKGDTVRVTNEGDVVYLELCEIIVYGIETSSEALSDEIDAVPKQLKISSAEGEGTKTPTSVIEKAFDGDNSTEGNKCYVQNANRPKEGRFTIPEAEVTNVFLLGKSNGGSTWEMADTVVQVCTGGNSNCTPCGRVTETPARGEFFDVKCAAGAKGDTVRVTNEGDVVYLQLCEIIVYGIAK